MKYVQIVPLAMSCLLIKQSHVDPREQATTLCMVAMHDPATTICLTRLTALGICLVYTFGMLEQTLEIIKVAWGYAVNIVFRT